MYTELFKALTSPRFSSQKEVEQHTFDGVDWLVREMALKLYILVMLEDRGIIIMELHRPCCVFHLILNGWDIVMKKIIMLVMCMGLNMKTESDVQKACLEIIIKVKIYRALFVISKAGHHAFLMPGKISCSAGLTQVYYGYLMTGWYNYPAATDYYCVDESPEDITGREANKDGFVLYFVESRCGSLQCPPYVDGREMTCVVCTK